MGYRLLTIGLIGLIGLIGVQSSVQAQDIRGALRDGNRSYKKEKWDEAAISDRADWLFNNAKKIWKI